MIYRCMIIDWGQYGELAILAIEATRLFTAHVPGTVFWLVIILKQNGVLIPNDIQT